MMSTDFEYEITDRLGTVIYATNGSDLAHAVYRDQANRGGPVFLKSRYGLVITSEPTVPDAVANPPETAAFYDFTVTHNESDVLAVQGFRWTGVAICDLLVRLQARNPEKTFTVQLEVSA